MASTNLIAHIASALFIIGLVYIWWHERQANELLKVLFRPGLAIRLDDSAHFLQRALEVVGIPVEFSAKGHVLKKIPMGLCAEWIQSLPRGTVTEIEDGKIEVTLPRDFSQAKNLEEISGRLTQILDFKFIYKWESNHD